MNWMQFISSLVGHLAWPSAVAGLVFWLRTPLQGLLNQDRPVESFEAGPAGLKIKYALEKAEQQLAEGHKGASSQRPDSTTPATPHPTPSDVQTLLDVAALDPTAAVLTAYARFEKKLRRTIPVDQGQNRYMPAHQLMRQAQKQNLVSAREINAFREVNFVRNTVAHEYDAVEMSSAEAEKFVWLLQDLEMSIERRLGTPGEPNAAV